MRTAEGQMWLYRQKLNRLLHRIMIGMRYTAASLSATEMASSQLQASMQDMALVVMCTA